MKTLQRLAIAAVLAALGTVVLGSWTRINGAGLTCPDWPLCRGELIPSMTGGTIWEWTHRLFAAAVAPLVVAVLAAAWVQRGRARFVAPAMNLIAALFVVQIGLGAATVRLGNSPTSVVLHWGTAMAFIAALCAMAIFAGAPEGDTIVEEVYDPHLSGILAGTALVAFATMCVGAYVSSSGAGLACLSMPGCAGNVVVYTDGQYVQMLHRTIAAATLLCSAISFAWSLVRPAPARVRAVVALGLVLVFVQVLLGLLNVALRLPMDLREAHAVNAAFVFIAFVVASLLSLLDSRVPARSASAKRS